MKMTKVFATAAIMLALVPSAAFAQHRADGAAIGALSGAVVLGPVGALVGAAAGAAAGALAGYFAEPAVAHSPDMTNSLSMRARRPRMRDTNRPVPPGRIRAAVASDPRAGMPGQQGPARVTHATGNVNSSAPAARPQPVFTEGLPPIQALD
jgi:uncharacterized protein YcfJ